MAKYPVSVNFKTLEQYSFSTTKLDEIIFFEWLIIKTKTFGSNTFFYQQERTINEIGIKIHRLTKIKEKYKTYGLIVDTGGSNNTTTYTVEKVFIKNFVNIHVKTNLQNDLINRIEKLNFNNININIEDRDFIEELIQRLNNVFRERREFEEQKNNGNIKYPYTELTANKKTYTQLNKLEKTYSSNTILNSFIAFSDALIRNEDSSMHVLNNFSSYDIEKDSFPVFERYLNIFNLNYSVQIN